MTNLLQEHRERVGRQIKRARKDAKLSHDRLAVQVGTSRQHLIRLEQGQHAPRADMLQKIADATGKEPSFFSESGDSDDDEDASMSIGAAFDLMFDRAVERRVKQILDRDRGLA